MAVINHLQFRKAYIAPYCWVSHTLNDHQQGFLLATACSLVESSVLWPGRSHLTSVINMLALSSWSCRHADSKLFPSTFSQSCLHGCRVSVFETTFVHNHHLNCLSLHLTLYFLLLEAFTELSLKQVDLGFVNCSKQRQPQLLLDTCWHKFPVKVSESNHLF